MPISNKWSKTTNQSDDQKFLAYQTGIQREREYHRLHKESTNDTSVRTYMTSNYKHDNSIVTDKPRQPKFPAEKLS